MQNIQISKTWTCHGNTCRAGLGLATTVSLLQKQRKKMKVHHSCGLILRSPNRQAGWSITCSASIRKQSTFTDMQASSPWGSVAGVQWSSAPPDLELMQCLWWSHGWAPLHLQTQHLEDTLVWSLLSLYEDSRCCREWHTQGLSP